MNIDKHTIQSRFCAAIDNNESFPYFVFYHAFAIFIILVSCFLQNGIKENDERTLYFLFFGACPFAIYFLYAFTYSPRFYNRSAQTFLLTMNGCLSLFILTLFTVDVFFHPSIMKGIKFFSIHYIFYIFSALYFILNCAALVLFFKKRLIDTAYHPFLNGMNRILFILIPIVFFLLFISGYRDHLYVLYIHYWIYVIVYLGVFALLICLCKYALPVRIKKWIYHSISAPLPRRILFWTGYLAVPFLLFFDTTLTFDYTHYYAYIGPAAAVCAGRPAMIDSFSQYGFLPFQLIAIYFSLIGASSFTAMAILINLFNILYYILFLLIIRKIVNNKVIAYSGGILFLILFNYGVYNMNITPSVSGYRFLPPLLVLLCLCYLSKSKYKYLILTIVVILNSFWSLETFVFSFVTYAAFLIGEYALSQDSVFTLCKRFLYLVAGLMTSHIVFIVLWLLYYGEVPRYDVYLGFLSTYKDSANFWYIEIVPRGNMRSPWAIVSFAYFLPLVIFLKKYFCMEKTSSHTFIHMIFPTAVLGVIEFAYFQGRSISSILLVSSFPFCILVLAGIDRMWVYQKKKIINDIGRIIPLYILTLFTIILIAVYSIDNIKKFYGDTYKPLAFSLIQNRANALKILDNMREYLKTPRFIQSSFSTDKSHIGPKNTSREVRRLKDAYDLIHKWASNEPELLLFMVEATALHVTTQKPHAYPISCNLTDSISEPITEKILNYPAAIHDGDLVFTYADEYELPDIDKKILAVLRKNYIFTPIDRSEYGIVVYKLNTNDGITKTLSKVLTNAKVTIDELMIFQDIYEFFALRDTNGILVQDQKITAIRLMNTQFDNTSLLSTLKNLLYADLRKNRIRELPNQELLDRLKFYDVRYNQIMLSDGNTAQQRKLYKTIDSISKLDKSTLQKRIASYYPLRGSIENLVVNNANLLSNIRNLKYKNYNGNTGLYFEGQQYFIIQKNDFSNLYGQTVSFWIIIDLNPLQTNPDLSICLFWSGVLSNQKAPYMSHGLFISKYLQWIVADSPPGYYIRSMNTDPNCVRTGGVYHVVSMMSANFEYAKLYVNGKKIVSRYKWEQPKRTDLSVIIGGAPPPYAAQPIKGILGEFAVWDRELTENEVYQLYVGNPFFEFIENE